MAAVDVYVIVKQTSDQTIAWRVATSADGQRRRGDSHV